MSQSYQTVSLDKYFTEMRALMTFVLHEFSSPTSAVVMGVDLLKEASTQSSDEQAIVDNSLQHLRFMLDYFKYAFAPNITLTHEKCIHFIKHYAQERMNVDFYTICEPTLNLGTPVYQMLLMGVMCFLKIKRRKCVELKADPSFIQVKALESYAAPRKEPIIEQLMHMIKAYFALHQWQFMTDDVENDIWCLTHHTYS